MHLSHTLREIPEILPLNASEKGMFGIISHAPLIASRAKLSQLVWEVNQIMEFGGETSFWILRSKACVMPFNEICETIDCLI